MTEIDFFPAAMVGQFNKLPGNLYKYSYWTDQSVFQHQKLLYSFYYLQDRYKKIKTGSYFDSIEYEGTRMIDSGGFQVKTIGAEIKADDVIDVYKRERADIGFVLDSPPMFKNDFGKVDWVRGNIKQMIKRKDEIPNTELLNVFQGMSLADKKKYYEYMKEFNEDLDGWAVGLVKRLPPIFNAWAFLYILEHDDTMKDKRFHFLGLTGNKNIPVIYYLAKLGMVDSISFDSTKYGREGILYDYRNPSYQMERISIGKNAFGKLTNNDFCPCPVCMKYTMEEFQSDVNLGLLHNLFWECRKFDFFNAFETAEGLKNHIFNHVDFYEETRVTINFIDYALENGLDKAEKQFARYFQENKIPVKQETLF